MAKLTTDDKHKMKIIKKSLLRYFDNKRIAIVGPAMSCMGSNNGREIDSYDIVVRMKGYKLGEIDEDTKRDYGIRTDVVYITPYKDISEDVIKTKQSGAKWVISTYDYTNSKTKIAEEKILKSRLQFGCARKKIRDDIKKKTILLPLSGVTAISHLLTFNIKELKIFAMDFFQTEYYDFHVVRSKQDALPKRSNKIHDMDSQFEYFYNHILIDKRVKCDKVLSEIVYNYNNKNGD